MKQSVIKEMMPPSKMIECGSVVIVNMCEALEVCECKDAKFIYIYIMIYCKMQVRLRESLWSILRWTL